MSSGEVVVAGDATDVEIWTPGTPAFIKVGESIDNGLAFSTATHLPNGSVIILGGYDNDIRPTAQAWVISRTRAADNHNCCLTVRSTRNRLAVRSDARRVGQ